MNIECVAVSQFFHFKQTANEPDDDRDDSKLKKALWQITKSEDQ